MNLVAAKKTHLAHQHLVDPAVWDRLVARIVKDDGYDVATAERIMDQATGFLRLCALEPDGQYASSQS